MCSFFSHRLMYHFFVLRFLTLLDLFVSYVCMYVCKNYMSVCAIICMLVCVRIYMIHSAIE